MKPRALVIEPDRILLQQYTLKLGLEFDVIAAVNAQEAIDALDSLDAIDVIVLDVLIGKNNGVELLHEIRSYDDWLEIPVIMLSSVPKNRLPVERLAKYGVERMLYKPQTAPHELLRQTRRVVFA